MLRTALRHRQKNHVRRPITYLRTRVLVQSIKQHPCHYISMFTIDAVNKKACPPPPLLACAHVYSYKAANTIRINV